MRTAGFPFEETAENRIVTTLVEINESTISESDYASFDSSRLLY